MFVLGYVTGFVVCSVVAGLTLFFIRRHDKRRFEASKRHIVAVSRHGITVAYRREDLPAMCSGMLMPSLGMMVFSDRSDRGITKKTGTLRAFQRLVQESCRTVIMENEYAFYVPFSSNNDAADMADYGYLILTEHEARERLRP